MKIKLDKLDILFSEYIRRRAVQRVYGCERCLRWKASWKELQACHFHSRRERSVRWDEDNCIGLCFGCHQYLDSHPLEKVEWFKQKLGEQAFDLLNARIRNREKPDKEALTLYYKTKIKELGGE